MDDGPGQQDPEREARERYPSESRGTDRIRPAGDTVLPHPPEHVPELQRALAAATAGIDAVEDRLSTLFDRAHDPARPERYPPTASASEGDPDDEIIELLEEEPLGMDRANSSGPGGDEGERDTLTDLDAALAAEEPTRVKRRFFRRP